MGIGRSLSFDNARSDPHSLPPLFGRLLRKIITMSQNGRPKNHAISISPPPRPPLRLRMCLPTVQACHNKVALVCSLFCSKTRYRKLAHWLAANETFILRNFKSLYSDGAVEWSNKTVLSLLLVRLKQLCDTSYVWMTEASVLEFRQGQAVFLVSVASSLLFSGYRMLFLLR